jgi:alkylation response protein AidB-like acyl-CoA dehydrogenase
MCQIRSGMDLTFGADHEAFRREARSWLAAHVPSEPLPSLQTAAGFEAHRAWEATMFADRWSAVSWPIEYGGRGLGVMEWLVFEEEYHRARAPERVSQNGISLLAPSLFEYGTAAQKDRFLLPIAAGEEIWCQSWPEPDTGSDLVAVRSRAVRNPKGDSWILNGQKTWANGGAFAQWCFGIFLTDPDAGRHGGWTYLLIAMDAPGVTVRPIRQMDGEAGLAEILLDDVEVPDIQVLGQEGSGWSIAMSNPGNERVFGLRSPARSTEAAARLIDLFDQRGAPPTAADAVARAYIDAQALALHTYWTASKIALGQPAGPEASCNKIFRSETNLAIHETAMALLGPDGELLEAGSPGEWLSGYPRALSGPLNAVTNEMQCNVVAEQLLGLSKG